MNATRAETGGNISLSGLTVAQVMRSGFLSCSPQTSVADVARSMTRARRSSIIVREDDDVLGIWTEHDALRDDFIDGGGEGVAIGDVMSTPVLTLNHGVSIEDAALRCEREGIRHFMVVDDEEQPLGLISQTEIVANHGVEWFMRLQRVASVLEGPPLTITPDTPLSGAASRMRGEGEHALAIQTDAGDFAVLTEQDILRHVASGEPDRPCLEAATHPMQTVVGTDSLYQARNIMAAGSLRHIGVVNDKGSLVGLIGFREIMHSIEQGYIEELEVSLRERNAELRASEERYRALVDASPDAIAVHRERCILFINPAGARLLGADNADALIASSLSDFVVDHNTGADGDDSAVLEQDSSAHPTEIGLQRMDGTDADIELQVMPISFNGEAAWQVIMRDITRRKEMELELRRLATTDQLTGIRNRPEFERHLDQEMRTTTRYGHPLSLIMFDLNRFKQINDHFGHAAGDEALQQIAATISTHLRDTDVFARWGGDEFMILLPETRHDGAERLCHKLCAGMRSLDNHCFGPVNAAFGLAEFVAGETRRDLLRRLDQGVYRAKELDDGAGGIAHGDA